MRWTTGRTRCALARWRRRPGTGPAASARSNRWARSASSSWRAECATSAFALRVARRGVRHHEAAVRVADEDDRSLDLGQPVLQVGGVDAEPAQGVGGRDHGIAALVQAVDNRRPARSIRERPVDEPPVGSGFAAAPAGPEVTAAPPRNTAMSRRATHARTPWRRLAVKTLTLPRAADWFAQQTWAADRAPGPGASRSHPVRCAEPSASRASGHRSRPCALTGLRRRSWERNRSSTATSNAVWGSESPPEA